MFDVTDCLEMVRSHSTEWLEARRHEVVGEVRRLQSEEHAILLVLDERVRIDTSIGMDGECARTVREKTETARALENLPAIAAAARAGKLSSEQLREVVKFADEESDAEWAERAQNMTPADLARTARTQSKPTIADGQARQQARYLRTWWDHDRGMLHVRGELPDVLGEKFVKTLEQLTERMRSPKGGTWERWEHRAADALGIMCDAVEVADKVEKPMAAPKPLFSIEVPPCGPATVAGIPLPDAMVEQLRASATIEPLLVEADGFPVGVGKRGSSLSPKIIGAVLRRDGHCRCGNCDLHFGLQAHHIRPRSWGGSDEISNLVAVASVHHPALIPNGPYAIVGNPNLPDGLRTVHINDLTPEEAKQVGLPPPRARPSAG